jgi:hypothetical protein
MKKRHFFTTCFFHFGEEHVTGDKSRKPYLNYTQIVAQKLKKIALPSSVQLGQQVPTKFSKFLPEYKKSKIRITFRTLMVSNMFWVAVSQA